MRAWVLFVLVSVMVGAATAEPSGVRYGRIIKVERAENWTLVTVAAGAEQGVGKDNFARIVTASGSDDTVLGGELMIIRVDRRTTIGKTLASIDQVTSHPWVQFQPRRPDAMTAP